MAQIIFVRHGESSANVDRVLAGRRPGVELTERGRAQASALVPRLGALEPDLVLRSSLLRCRQTAALAVPDREAIEDTAFDEVDYGDWSGERLDRLFKHPLWKDLVRDPATMEFPGGESLQAASARTVAGISRVLKTLRAVEAAAGHAGPPSRAAEGNAEGASGDAAAPAPRPATAVIVSHGDIVKFALLHALGTGVAGLHRITVANGSLSVIDYRDADNPNVCAVSVTGESRHAAGTLGG